LLSDALQDDRSVIVCLFEHDIFEQDPSERGLTEQSLFEMGPIEERLLGPDEDWHGQYSFGLGRLGQALALLADTLQDDRLEDDRSVVGCLFELDLIEHVPIERVLLQQSLIEHILLQQSLSEQSLSEQIQFEQSPNHQCPLEQFLFDQGLAGQHSVGDEGQLDYETAQDEWPPVVARCILQRYLRPGQTPRRRTVD
jgi:hypothetical protein